MSCHRTIIRLSAVLAVVALATGCGDGDSATAPPTPEPARPTTVTVSPATDELTALGQTIQLTAEVRDQNSSVMAGATVTWSSGSASVATVDGMGLVTAVGNGEATITASTGSASGSAVVTVMQSVVSVEVSPSADELTALGATVQLTAEAFDENGQAVAGAKFSWESSDVAVATVDAAGLLTAAGNGTATVTASAGSASGSAVVTVMQTVASLEASPATHELTALGTTIQLTAEAFDGNGHVVAGAEFSWESSDAAVATVDAGGLVTGVAEGVVTITASAGEAEGTAEITVLEPKRYPDLAVASPAVSENSPAAGIRFTLSATVRNNGDGASPPTTLRYYRSSDASITASDTEVATSAVAGLAANASAIQSVEVTAPSTSGTYYYGACADAVVEELNTNNNCSTFVQVSVPWPGPPVTVEGGLEPTIQQPAWLNRERWDALVFNTYDYDGSPIGFRTNVLERDVVSSIRVCMQSPERSEVGKVLEPYSDASWWRFHIRRWTGVDWNGEILIADCTREPAPGWIHVRAAQGREIRPGNTAYAGTRYDEEGRWVWSQLVFQPEPPNPEAWEPLVIEGILAHELGHALGFHHVPGDRPSWIMQVPGVRPWPEDESRYAQLAYQVGPNVRYPGLTPPTPKSNDAALSTLVLSDGTDMVDFTPSFDSGTQSYMATVANSVTSVTFTPTVSHPNATLTVNGSVVARGSTSDMIELEIGENIIEVVVTAQDGATVLTYTVTVTRATAVPVLSLGATLLLGMSLVGLCGRPLTRDMVHPSAYYAT